MKTTTRPKRLDLRPWIGLLTPRFPVYEVDGVIMADPDLGSGRGKLLYGPEIRNGNGTLKYRRRKDGHVPMSECVHGRAIPINLFVELMTAMGLPDSDEHEEATA